MKRIVLILCFVAPIAIQAQTKVSIDSLLREVKELRRELHTSDLLNKLYLDGIYNNIDKPRYKMYQT